MAGLGSFENLEKKMIRWTSIVLAGGKGTRMQSPLPKVLHPVAGQPLIARVIEAAKGAGVDETRVVVGYGENLVRRVVEPLGALCFKQHEQNGTADAVKSADFASLKGFVLIVNGDHPLIGVEDLKGVMDEFEKGSAALAVVTAELSRPGNYGRIVRHKGALRAIVEAGDASASTLAIKEVNTGIYLVRAEVLVEFLPQIKNHNAKGEYYLTDLVELCKENGHIVEGIQGHRRLSAGVNTQLELARATQFVFRQKAKELLAAGVVMIDPRSTYIEESVSVGAGSVIYPGVHLKGNTTLGSFCVVEPNCFISDSEIHESVQIRMGSHLEKCVVKGRAVLGPYARIRPETELGEEVQIGNFVELKKTVMAKGAKAAHLSYLGDAEVGEKANIGCGTITCNYAVDRKKYQTKIGSGVFVGSDSQLVAPVSVGDNAIIASGSTITRNVPANALAIGRSRQENKENYSSKISKNTAVESSKTATD